MPSVKNDPEAIDAPKLLSLWTTVARRSRSSAVSSNSVGMTCLAPAVMIRCVSKSV